MFSNGDSRSFCITAKHSRQMQNTITMGHAPAVRASRALRTVNVREMCVRALSIARSKSVTLAVISAATCYAGALIGHDPMTYTAAFVALGFVALANSTRKGGEK